MKITIHNPSIADLTKTLFFFDHFSRKIYRQNDDRNIVQLLTIFHEKSPRPSAAWIWFFLVENKTNIGEEQNARWKFSFFFLFWIHKKTFHTKTHFGSKNTASTRSGWCKHFLSQNGFLCEIFFFCMFKTKRKMEISIWRFVPHLYLFCFLPKQITNLHSWGRRSGAYFMKNSQQMDDVPIFIPSIYFSEEW